MKGGIIETPMAFVLSAIYGIVGNYAVTIVIFTVIIRLILFPLYSAQMRSSQQMMEIQPLLREIQTKYANKPQEMNEKVQELYQEYKINPAMGCLPLLIQLPIIWGLFSLLRNPLRFIDIESNSDMVLAVHESFFWIPDLGQPDTWILPILAGLTTFVSMKLTMSMSSQAAGGASMKVMQYFTPVMIVVMGRIVPSGLCLYWIVGYIFQIIQAKVMRVIREKKKEKGR